MKNPLSLCYDFAGVDCVRNEVNCRSKMEAGATLPLQYVVAFEADRFRCRDVTAKYAHAWLLEARKVRADETWWRDVTAAFEPKSRDRNAREDLFIKGLQEQAPMPSTVQEFKNHPLYVRRWTNFTRISVSVSEVLVVFRYVLKRHLLKFEALYPSDVTPVGYIKNEAVYRRENVYTLHSRETWLKEARMVRVSCWVFQFI